jgi:hypothetical protein
MSATEIVWSWGARATACGFMAAFAALAMWAAVDPRTSASVVVFAGSFALACALLAVETWVFRVRVDAEGLRRRSLRGTDALAWHEVRAVRSIASRHEGMSIVHRRTSDIAEAFHVRLVTGRAGARPWDFNGWMTGLDALVAELAARALPQDLAWPTPVPPIAARALRVLEAANSVGLQLVAGFSLLFVLGVASMAIVSALDLAWTGHILLDVLLVGLGLLGCLGLLGSLAKLLGARRFVASGGSAGERRTAWMLDAAGSLGGVLLVVAFVPRVLGGAGDWGDWLLLAFGVGLVASALRG